MLLIIYLYLMSYSQESAKHFIEKWYNQSVIPSLSDFVRIPNLSRSFDKDYKTNGLLQKAANHVKSWIEGLGLKGLKTELMQPEDLTPLLLAQIEGQIKDKTIVFYGHFDKQPHGTGWDQNKGPTTPTIQNDRLYGRGSSDDGYSAYSYMLAIRALQQQGIPLPNIILLLEGDEESGGHIDVYLERLKERLGKIDIFFVLDSEVADFVNFWNTKSIRGSLSFVLRVKILRDGVHSGDSSGIVPSTFKIVNQLLSRLQNLQNGQVHEYFQREIPVDRYQELYQNAKEIGMEQFSSIKTIQGLQYTSSNPLDVLINRGWKPTLTVTGLTGFPACKEAGNVMLPEVSLRVSIRLPPTFQNANTETFVRQLLTQNTPFGATVYLEDFDLGYGWNSKPYEPWFQEVSTTKSSMSAYLLIQKLYIFEQCYLSCVLVIFQNIVVIQQSSQQVFGSKSYAMAQGSTIPLIGTIAKTWPNASIIVSGILGPNSNAHGPNQFLHLPYAMNLTRMIASIIAKSSQHYLQQTS